MKKKVMFYMSYKGETRQGHHASIKEYSIFTRKSKIVNDLFNWQTEKQKEATESIITLNIKIIGL